MIEVAIIGAGGPSGLVSCKTAKAQGMQVTGFEKTHRIGGVWSADAMSDGVRGHARRDLTTNISRYSSMYPDFPWPENTPIFPTTQQMYDYLHAYAQYYQLNQHINFGCDVVKVESNNNKWIVHWKKDGILHQKTFDALIVATGKFACPHIPAFEGLDKIPADNKMHSAQMYNNELFRRLRVLVVGGGVSGIDIAEKISEVTHVDHVFRRACYLLKKLERVDPLHSNLVLPSDIPYFYQIYSDLPSQDAQFQKMRILCSEQQNFSEWKMEKNASLGAIFSDYYIDRMKSKKITPYKSEIDCFTRDLKNDCNRAILKDGRNILFDQVIFCTGYEKDMLFFPDNIQEAVEKSSLYQDMFPLNGSNIAFVGLYAGPPGLAIFAQQAKYACQILNNKKTLPPIGTMQKSITLGTSGDPKAYLVALAKEMGEADNRILPLELLQLLRKFHLERILV